MLGIGYVMHLPMESSLQVFLISACAVAATVTLKSVPARLLRPVQLAAPFQADQAQSSPSAASHALETCVLFDTKNVLRRAVSTKGPSQAGPGQTGLLSDSVFAI